MIYAIIVIYNKSCENSLTLQYLCNNDSKINVIVYDNSEKDFNNYVYCLNRGWKYITCNKNVGLSVAYNTVIKSLSINKDDYIMILDDDTHLNDNYLNEALNLTKYGEYDVLLPIVKAGKFILSPSNVKFKCGSRVVKDVSELIPSQITAINSGMIIKRNVYNYILYDESLFLDLVDHQFMKDVENNNCRIKIMNSTLVQTYSRNEKTSKKSAYKRYKIYCEDFKVYCRNNNAMFFYRASITKLCIYNCLKYRTLSFLK